MENRNSHLLQLAGTILAMTTIISLIVLVIGHFAPWGTPTQFNNGFFIAGAIAILIGVLSVTGGFAQRANFNMTYAESAGRANIAERTQRMLGDIRQRYGVVILIGSVGILLIATSVLITQFTTV